MKFSPQTEVSFKALKLICLGFFLIFSTSTAYAQVSVYTTQNLSFGAFILGNSGGSVTVSNTGVRSATGDLVLAGLGVFYFPATLEIEAPSGTLITISYSINNQLTSTNGGTIMLTPGVPDKGYSFPTNVSPPQRTSINIGGTLNLGTQQSNPPGNYSGTFNINFIYQ